MVLYPRSVIAASMAGSTMVQLVFASRTLGAGESAVVAVLDGRSVVIESRGGVWLSEVGDVQAMVSVVRSSRRDMGVGRMCESVVRERMHAAVIEWVVGGSRTAPTGLCSRVGFGYILGCGRTRRFAAWVTSWSMISPPMRL